MYLRLKKLEITESIQKKGLIEIRVIPSQYFTVCYLSYKIKMPDSRSFIPLYGQKK